MSLQQTELDALVRTFASEWLRVSDPRLAERIVSDPLVVLGPDGASPVPRSTFLAAVATRAKVVEDSRGSTTTLVGASAHSVGDRIVLATISWRFSSGAGTTTLVSDFLLERVDPHDLRCIAYLPRTNVLEHLEH